MAKVLIIDDSPIQVKLMRKMLEKLGHSIYEAEDGEKGLQLLETIHPDLVMLDVVMPGMNGFDVTRQIRKNSSCKNVPIVLASTKSQETDKQWGLRQGANGYLVKPFNKNELMAVIGGFLEQSDSGDKQAAGS